DVGQRLQRQWRTEPEMALVWRRQADGDRRRQPELLDRREILLGVTLEREQVRGADDPGRVVGQPAPENRLAGIRAAQRTCVLPASRRDLLRPLVVRPGRLVRCRPRDREALLAIPAAESP